MRQPDINFVRPRRSPGQVLAGAFVGIGVLLASWLYWDHRDQKQSLEAELRRLATLKLVPTNKVAERPNAPPPWLPEAQVSLTHDWNNLFSHLEVVSVEGTKLMSVQAGVHPAGVRVEFELDGWLRVSELNEALNQSLDTGRWNLQSVSPASGANVVAGPVRAMWTR
jgi:hypothetical protein